MHTISPCLWFDTQAEEAAELYVSLFPESRIRSVVRHGADGPGPAGSVMLVVMELAGQEVQALNGGPSFTFSEATSLAVTVRTQDEVDRLWDGLTADGGRPGRCGWLKDRFGFSWQVVPAAVQELIGGPDPERSARAMRALMGMTKIDIVQLHAAADGHAA